MSHRPDDRYDPGKALADDIERWMADESVSAWKEPWNRKLVRWVDAPPHCGHRRRRRHADGVGRAGGRLRRPGPGQWRAETGQRCPLRRQWRVVQANLQLEEANENVTRANDELKAANVREHERFDLAMEAIKLFHGDISKDLLLENRRNSRRCEPNSSAAQADFYGKLEGLLKDRQDKQSRAALGRCAYEELGGYTFSIGDSARALDVFRKAVNVRRVLSDEPDARRRDQAGPGAHHQLERRTAGGDRETNGGHGRLRRNAGHGEASEAGRLHVRAGLPGRGPDHPKYRLVVPPDGPGGNVG